MLHTKLCENRSTVLEKMNFEHGGLVEQILFPRLSIEAPHKISLS